MLDIPPAPQMERPAFPFLFLSRQAPADQVRYIADWIATNACEQGDFGRLAHRHVQNLRTASLLLRSAVDEAPMPRKPWWRIFR